VTFDDDNVIYGLTDFGGNTSEIVVDPTDESNMVAKSIKTAGAETWAGTTVGGSVGLANPIPFTESFTTMSVRVWSPEAGIPIRLKVEDASDDTKSVETEDLTTVAMEWETLFFDFSNEAEGTAELNLEYTYNKPSIFFDFGTTGGEDEQTYYWDDIVFVDETGIPDNYSVIGKIYPNPATDVIYIENAEKLQNIFVYSLNGKIVFRSDKETNSIDLNNFKPGMYTLLANGSNGKQYMAKFVVK